MVLQDVAPLTVRYGHNKRLSSLDARGRLAMLLNHICGLLRPAVICRKLMSLAGTDNENGDQDIACSLLSAANSSG
jgi:hypothetical protein